MVENICEFQESSMHPVIEVSGVHKTYGKIVAVGRVTGKSHTSLAQSHLHKYHPTALEELSI